MSFNTNHLRDEESPYLKQHATNPVDWYPWGDEAFELAIKLDKPVFLSIGYSTCHWCHVMEKESFSKPEVGKAMNDTFVCIKVDREERPDVDSLYMSIAMREKGSGGWPLNMILTPDRKPVTSFTYLPIHSIHGNIGIIELSETIKTLWKDERDSLLERADQLISSNVKEEDSERVKVDSEKLFKHAFSELKKVFDYDYGGIGTGMKFPSPHNIIFLIKYYNYFGDEEALQMAENTLLAMRRGGIFDHVGYGFHRYSTDREWRVPHFEKMLYDQAWIMTAYSYAYATTKKEFYKQVISEIFEFLQREMKSPDGGYYTAIDADSEGEEGKFYLWTEDELKAILNEDFDEFKNLFDINSKGNFFNEREQTDTGLNIIYPKYNSFITPKNENGLEWMNEKAQRSLKILLQKRAKRIRPQTDTKVIASTNGMILSALSIAYLATFDDKYKEASTELLEFVKKKFIKEDCILRIEYNNGKEIPGLLEDYTNIIDGLLQYYRGSMNEEALLLFYTLMNFSIENFKDRNGSFHERQNSLMNIEYSELYDGAVPSSNSIMLRNAGFFALLNGFYDLATDIASLDRDLLTIISSNSTSFTWLINALFENSDSLIIKVPLTWDSQEFIKKSCLLAVREKILKVNNSNTTEICKMSECIYKFIEQKKTLEKLKEL
ncbi:MAG: thioredoxin domain-containing protein [Thermoplasmataceae archaeon]